MDRKIVTFDVALKSTEMQRVQKIPEVYTNDLNSVSLQFRIMDCTDTELTGSTAIVLLKMRDGSFFQGPSADVDRTLNVFSYTLKENEGNHDGLAEIQLIVTISAKEFATQKYQFKVNSGLDSEVAREIMIYDWTTLTAEARAYIDQFTADEMLRDAEFDNAQFDRNAAFVISQGQRTTDFDLAQTQRVNAFNASEAARVQAFNASEAARDQAFNEAETDRAAGYDADHSRAETDHTGATTDRTNAATDRTNAATDRTNAAADRTNAAADRALAGSDHTRAESDHTRADADSATVAGFNARMVDVEADTSLDGTNMVTNGDFSNGTTGWVGVSATNSVTNKILTNTSGGTWALGCVYRAVPYVGTNRYYARAEVRADSVGCDDIRLTNRTNTTNIYKTITAPVQNVWYTISGVLTNDASSNGIRLYHNYSTPALALGKAMSVKNVLVLDLTTIFGAGNEPTVEQMDAIMAKFPNSWFDGTKNLFQAKASLNKLMALDARTEFEMRNEVVNGDFSNGSTGWNITGNSTVVNGEVYKTVAQDGANVDIKFPTGNKVYLRASVRSLNALEYVQVVAYDYATYVNGVHVARTNALVKTAGSIIKTVAGGGIRIDFNITGTTTGGYMDDILAIDLTKAFGAGKEPTLAEMDRLMARYPNSWFDGTKPIQTIETLYLEKANKVQEAWIYPTLLNGWTGTARYRKNEFNEVRIELEVMSGTGTIFNLIAGYRPSKTTDLAANANGGFGNIRAATSGAVSKFSGATGYLLSNGGTFVGGL